jgi:hypothetical protein
MLLQNPSLVTYQASESRWQALAKDPGRFGAQHGHRGRQTVRRIPYFPQSHCAIAKSLQTEFDQQLTLSKIIELLFSIIGCLGNGQLIAAYWAVFLQLFVSTLRQGWGLGYPTVRTSAYCIMMPKSDCS